MPKTAAAAHREKTVSKAGATRPGSAAEKRTTDPVQPRVLHLPKRIWYKPLTWRHRPPAPVRRPLPKARIIMWTIVRQVRGNWKLFGGIVLLYGVLNLLLVRGFAGSNDLTSIKSSFDSVLSGVSGKILSSLAAFGSLFASSGSGSATSSGVYQYILLFICSLAFIWALRQVVAGHKIRVRDSFYSGMYPLVPLILVVLIMGIQLLPLIIGGNIYSLILSNGIAVVWWEKILFLVTFLLLALWTLRMIGSSVFAIYIVTLPNMTPLKALRSARQLVYRRRLLVWRKLIFLPVILLLLAILIEFPLILFVTPVAPWMFFVLTAVALPVAHGYLYNLYREML